MFTHRERRELQEAGRLLLGDFAGVSTSTLLYVLIFVFYGQAFEGRLPNRLNGKWLDAADDQALTPDRVAVWCRQLLQIVSDVIVIGRFWAVCGTRATIFPFIVLLAVCAICFANLAFTLPYFVSFQLFVAFAALSAAMNTFITVMVGFLAWKYGKLWHFGMGKRKSGAQTVLLLLAESGCLYCVLQIFNAVFINLSSEDGSLVAFVAITFREIYTLTTGMYPMTILLIVTRIKSSMESSFW
ncbi:hypothetical protein DXG01_003977 [Tephrocybe rancida]|nr:hypothetical protein DXG01_003977 [Tephrocybe rancida]